MNKRIGLGLILSAAMAISALGQADPYTQLPTYDVGSKNDVVNAILQEVQTAKQSDYPAIEKKLIVALETQGATYACKKFACEAFRIIGSEACVTPVLKLLADEKTADLARFALEGNPAKSVDEGLAAACKSSPAAIRTGIINTLAARKSDKLAILAKEYLDSGKPDMFTVALHALNRCGCPTALEMVKSSKAPSGLEALREQTLCDIACKLATNGVKDPAIAVFEEQFTKGTSLPSIISAMNGLVDYSKEPLPCVTKALNDPRDLLAMAAAKATQRMTGEAVTKALCTALPDLKPNIQVAVLAALAERADKTAITAIKTAMASTNDSVKAQAALALEKTGDASVVTDLITLASGDGDPSTAARWTLGRLNASGIDEAMIKMLDDSDPKKIRIAALTLTARGNTAVMPTLLKLAESDKPDIRNAALEALDGFAAGDEVAKLVALLQKAPRDVSGKIATVLWKATKGYGVDDTRYVKMWAAAAGSPDSSFAALLPLATAAGGSEPLKIVTDTMANGNTNLLDPAARTLFNWPNHDSVAPTIDFMKKTTDAKYRILGARSVVRILNDRKCNWPDKKKIETLEQVLTLMERAEDRKMIEEEITKFKEGKTKK